MTDARLLSQRTTPAASKARTPPAADPTSTHGAPSSGSGARVGDGIGGSAVGLAVGSAVGLAVGSGVGDGVGVAGVVVFGAGGGAVGGLVGGGSGADLPLALVRAASRLKNGQEPVPLPWVSTTHTMPRRGLEWRSAEARTISLRPSPSKSAMAGELKNCEAPVSHSGSPVGGGGWRSSMMACPARFQAFRPPSCEAATTSSLPSPSTSARTGEPMKWQAHTSWWPPSWCQRTVPVRASSRYTSP